MHTPTDRRSAMSVIGVAGIGALAVPVLGVQPAGQPPTQPAAQPLGGPLSASEMGYDAAKGEYVLPPLPYATDALEPHMDAATVELHHGKHHNSYVEGLNKALKALADIRAGTGDASLVKHWSREIAFHGSGHVNHTLFWNMMAPAGKGGGGEPSGKLAEMITRDFGSNGAFVKQFTAAAVSVEGSGWAYLAFEPMARKLMVVQGEKHQNHSITGVRLILAIDMWEHAYYLKHQNKRPAYVAAFMNIVNWPFCARLLDHATA